MNLALESLILVGGLLFLLAIGLEIGIAIGIVASIGLIFFVGKPLTQFGATSFEQLNSFILTAMPLFIFMGTILSASGVTIRLFDAANKWLSYLPGGVGCAVIGANAVFGAISGSSIAACSTFGRLAVPEMDRIGYDPKLSLGSVAVGGGLAMLIPPSFYMIVYGGYTSQSVVKLFAGGLIPGILLTLLLILNIVIWVLLKPSLAPRSIKSSWRDRLLALRDTLPFVLLILTVLGLVFGGVMTATEAAAVGALFSIVLVALYRRLNFAVVKESMTTAVKVSVMVALLIVMARVLGQVFQYIGLTESFNIFMHSLPLGKFGILITIVLMYILLGMFLDGVSMLIITIPFVAPLITSLGFDLLWFGIVYVVLAEIGFITPPFGINLFALHAAVPQHNLTAIVKGSLYLYPALFLIIVLMIVFPQLILWLPGVLY